MSPTASSFSSEIETTLVAGRSSTVFNTTVLLATVCIDILDNRGSSRITREGKGSQISFLCQKVATKSGLPRQKTFGTVNFTYF